MIYLDWFTFPDEEVEFDFFMRQKRTCYDSFYPFQILSRHHFRRIDFAPVTILYGGNGTGKTTAINVIAEKLGLDRDSAFNRSNFFWDYLERCDFEARVPLPGESRIITSDDVFDYMLNIRSMNEGIDRKKESLFEEYLDAKYSHFQMRSLDDYEKLKKVNKARSKTQSRFVRSELMDTIREYSKRRKCVFCIFRKRLQSRHYFCWMSRKTVCLLSDSRSWCVFIEDSVRFYGCQFVISTHSPFVLSMKGAKIYDLDEDPVDVKHWTELENIKAYYKFFKKHEHEFHFDNEGGRRWNT